MKFPGKLEAGLQSGVLTESKYIKGTYIVFSTETEKNSFTNCGCKEVLVKGTKCYVASEKQEYRWDGSKWIALQTDIPAAPADGKIYGIQNNQWVEVNVAGLDATIEEIDNNLRGIENSISDLQDRVGNNTNMVNYLNAQLLNKADKNDIPTQTSQLENDSGFITLNAVKDKFATVESVDSLTNIVNNNVTSIDNLNKDVESLQESISNLDNTVVKYTEFTTPESVEVFNKKVLGNSVDIDDPTTPSLGPNGSETVITQVTRKTIQLDNYDSISGLDTEGNGHNLAMVSKWNVADFGAAGLHLNLNTKDNVTINGNLIVLTTEDKKDLQNEIQQAVANAEHIHFEVVEELPTTDIDTNVIYLVADGEFYNEYIYVEGKWDSIGTTNSVDLTNYYNRSQTEDLIDSKIEDSIKLYPTPDEIDAKINNATSTLATKESLGQLEDRVDSLSNELSTRYSNEHIDEAIQEVDNKLDQYVTVETYTQNIEVVNDKINNKQDRLISEGINQNIKTINGQSILGNGNIEITGGGSGNASYTLPVATTTTLGGIKSGTYESEDGTILSVVVDEEGKATVKMPTLEQSADQKDIVDVLNSGVEKVLISGGNASE